MILEVFGTIFFVPPGADFEFLALVGREKQGILKPFENQKWMKKFQFWALCLWFGDLHVFGGVSLDTFRCFDGFKSVFDENLSLVEKKMKSRLLSGGRTVWELE